MFPVTPNGCITRLSDGGLTPSVRSPSIEPSLAQSNELTMSHNRGIYSSVTLTIARRAGHSIQEGGYLLALFYVLYTVSPKSTHGDI